MIRNHIFRTTAICAASLCLIVPTRAQSVLAGSANRAAEDYKNCMAEHVADYALRSDTPEVLAREIASRCVDEVVALSVAYVDEFFANRTTKEAKSLAKIYVDQITSSNLEIVRLDITRRRIEADNRR